MRSLYILLLLFLSQCQSVCVEGEGKLCIESIIGNGSLKPLFTCWFTTYINETRHRNAVMGYNNTFADDVRAIQGGGDNKLFIDGIADVTTAPAIFSAGLHPLMFVIASVNVIDWLLDDTHLVVTLATQDASTMCYHLYNHTCGGASSFVHFCEDDIFCNGEEVCASHNCISNRSVCIGQGCSEDPPRCTITVEPTGLPTLQPTIQLTTAPTLLPIEQPTLQPTIQPTNTPTILATLQPTIQPTTAPTNIPTTLPTLQPTIQPTSTPTTVPTTCPTTVSSCFVYRKKPLSL